MTRFALWLGGAALAPLAMVLLVVVPPGVLGDEDKGTLKPDEVGPEAKQILGADICATVAQAETVTVYKVAPGRMDDPEIGIPGYFVERKKELDPAEALKAKRALLDGAALISRLDRPPATPAPYEFVLRFRHGTEVATAAVGFGDEGTKEGRLHFIEGGRDVAVRRGALSELLASTFPKP